MRLWGAAPSPLALTSAASSSGGNSHVAVKPCIKQPTAYVCFPVGPRSRACGAFVQQRTRRTAGQPITCLHKALRQAGASAAATSSSSSSSHRPTSPEDTTLELLTLLRKPADMQQLAPWIASELLLPPGTPIAVGGQQVVEMGPLARCARFMDAAARRVLPGHLLRRCRVLSSLTSGDTCQQRVALTACSGEEVVLQWRLARCPHNTGSSNNSSSGGSSSSSSSSGRSSRASGALLNAAIVCEDAASTDSWRLVAASRDACEDSEVLQLPLRPRPRAAPELLLHAQLAALQAGDLASAAAFTRWGRLRQTHHAASADGSSDAHMAGFKALMRQHPYHQLLTNNGKVTLGAAALPSQRTFVQEVWLQDAGRDTSRPVFVWEMGMAADGCWVVDGIRAVA